MKLIETMKADLHAVRTRGLRIIVVVTAALALVACDDDGVTEDGVIEPVDSTAGAVFTMSNAREGNAVVAFSRAPDGTLTEVGRFPTGGTGSGSFEDSSNSMILGNAQGESLPNNLIAASKPLFVTNAGSNSLTVSA